MKIKKNKGNNNIDEESKNALKDFRMNQINSNIKLHKIIIILIVLINLGLIFFIFFYKTKIAQIKKLSSSYTSDIDSQDTQLVTQRTSLYHKMVNIASLGTPHSSGVMRFSFIFEKSDEFQKIKKIVFNYRKEIGQEIFDYDKIYPLFIYQGITDSDDFYTFLSRISFFDDIVILIRTELGKKFGIYHKDSLKPTNDKNEYISNCKDVFLFTFDNDGIYKFIGKKASIQFNKDKMISLGKDELVIYNDFFTKGGYINFPLQSFDFSNVNSNILTGENGNFNIRNIEVYSFYP
jgi:hypothetical protein